MVHTCKLQARHSLQPTFAALLLPSYQPNKQRTQILPKNCQTQLGQGKRKETNYEFHYFHNSSQEEHKKKEYQIKK